MTTVVASWNNNQLIHITDAANPRAGDPVKTRCGRTLVNFHVGYFSDQLCPKCGDAADFDQISSEMREIERAKREREQAENEAMKKRNAARLETHRRLMAEFREMFQQAGASITDVQEKAAGSSFEFTIDGLKFYIRGDIW